MRLACSLGPAWAELASCVNSSTERTCALFSLTFMALVNSLNGPKRAADYTFPHPRPECLDRKSTRLNSSHDQISYAVFCLKKKKKKDKDHTTKEQEEQRRHTTAY